MFDDRIDAGRQLAAALAHHRGESLVVIGLPRGGVPVAAEVARALGAPLDVIVVRKLGVPGQPELGMGAIAEDGVRVLDDRILAMTRTSPAEVSAVERAERAELVQRVQRLRAVRPLVDLHGKSVVIVDDGIATGGTARAACHTARARGAASVVLAVPVAPTEARERFRGEVDELVAVQTSDHFRSVGQFYRDFSPVSDQDVVDCLRSAGRARHEPEPHPAPQQPSRSQRRPAALDVQIEVPVEGARLRGQLTVPMGATGVVVFAHGTGSSRYSPRNRFVAARLNDRGLATVLVDLLTSDEELDRSNVFDVGLLADRLGRVTTWSREQFRREDLAVGYFGASTGAAAALHAAAQPDARISAVVSRGGRPDLAGADLGAVTAPTLLIVGGRDSVVLELNRRAQAELRCVSRLEVVPGATHLFEEPGALDAVARLAGDWFVDHLAHPPAGGAMHQRGRADTVSPGRRPPGGGGGPARR